MLAQHPPELIIADIAQRFGQQGTAPTGVAGRRCLVELTQNAPLAIGIVVRGLARTHAVLQAWQPELQKAPPPFRNSSRARMHRIGDLHGALALTGQQDDAGAFHQPMFAGAGPQILVESAIFFGRETNHRSWSGHAQSLRYIAN